MCLQFSRRWRQTSGDDRKILYGFELIVFSLGDMASFQNFINHKHTTVNREP